MKKPKIMVTFGLLFVAQSGHPGSDFKPLKLVTHLISADREFSIEIGLVGDLKIQNLEIVNINTNNIYFY